MYDCSLHCSQLAKWRGRWTYTKCEHSERCRQSRSHKGLRVPGRLDRRNGAHNVRKMVSCLHPGLTPQKFAKSEMRARSMSAKKRDTLGPCVRVRGREQMRGMPTLVPPPLHYLEPLRGAACQPHANHMPSARSKRTLQAPFQVPVPSPTPTKQTPIKREWDHDINGCRFTCSAHLYKQRGPEALEHSHIF